MLFSVIVPAKNVQKELPECILSILRQSCRDFELILVYGNSKDDTFDCCMRFAVIDKRIRVLRAGDSSRFEQKKMGVDAAVGDYLTVLPADARAEKDFLYEIKRTLGLGRYDFVGFPLYRGKNQLPLSGEGKQELYRDFLFRQEGICSRTTGYFAEKAIVARAYEEYVDEVGEDEEDCLLLSCLCRGKGYFSSVGCERTADYSFDTGVERLSQEESLFRQMNAVVDETDCSFLRPAVTLHAFFTTVEVLRDNDEETFSKLFDRTINSAFYFAMKELDRKLLTREEKTLLDRITLGNKKRAYASIVKIEKKEGKRKG